jgi:hypothetical protein
LAINIPLIMQANAGIGARIVGNGAGCLIVAVRCTTISIVARTHTHAHLKHYQRLVTYSL